MSAPISAVYGDDHFFRTNPNFPDQVRNLGFNRLICSFIRVFANGDLYYGSTKICDATGFIPGTGPTDWNTQLQQVKTGGTVNQVLISIGGQTAGGVKTYTNIQTLLGNFDPSHPDPTNIIYQRFTALFGAMTAFDGVDLDVEDNFSATNYPYFVTFCRMLSLILNGTNPAPAKKLYFCPAGYVSRNNLPSSFWGKALGLLNRSNPGLVAGYNLQCYSGGDNNLNKAFGYPTPLKGMGNYITDIKTALNCTTRQALEFISPGLWVPQAGDTEPQAPAEMQKQFNYWARLLHISGAWVWMYDGMVRNSGAPNNIPLQAWPASVSNGLQRTSAIIYGRNAFYSGTAGNALGTINQCGFTTIVCAGLQVNPDGSLGYNGRPVCAGGNYTGDSGWPAALQQVKNGGSVNRILLSIGSTGSTDFANIKALMNGPGVTALTANFKAILKALPDADGIDFNMNDTFDQDSTVKFAQMLDNNTPCREVTFSPYNNMAFWQACLTALDGSNHGFVTAYNLQCFGQGAPNLQNLQDWATSVNTAFTDAENMLHSPNYPNDAYDTPAFVNVALQSLNGADCMQGTSPMQTYKLLSALATTGTTGCCVWYYEDMIACGNNPADYAQAIIDGLVGHYAG